MTSGLPEKLNDSEIIGPRPLASALERAIGMLAGGTGSDEQPITVLGLPKRKSVALRDIPADMPEIDSAASWPAPLRSALGAPVWRDAADGRGWCGYPTEYLVRRVNPPDVIGKAREYWSLYRETCAPLDTDGTLSELARLRVKVAKRPDEDLDWQLTLDVLLDELEPYPADIVVGELRMWARTERWWPTWAELKARLDRRVAIRRGLMWTLEKIAKSQPEEEAAPRLVYASEDATA